jgi:hypothetical protein
MATQEIQQKMENDLNSVETLDIVPVDDLSKCLSINNSVIKYALFNNKVYINLTELCKAEGKEYKHWRSIDATELFLDTLSRSVGIPTDLILNITTGKNENRASWGHPQVAINIAYWLSPAIQVQVTKWIYELGLLGKVELGKEKTTIELDQITLEKYKEAEVQIKKLLKDKETLDKECVKLLGEKTHLEIENKSISQRAHILECDAKHGLYKMRENREDTYDEMLYRMQIAHFKPVYIRRVTAEEICEKYPNDGENVKFISWYIVNEPLKKKVCECCDSDAESEEYAVYSDYDEETWGKPQKQKKPKKKTKKVTKKVTKPKKIMQKPDTDSELEDLDYDSEDDDYELKNNVTLENQTYELYKRRAKNTQKRFYTISTKPKKNTKYSVILYATPDNVKHVVSGLSKYKKHQTPDPEVFEVSILEINCYLMELYINKNG